MELASDGEMKLFKAPRLSPQVYRKKVHYSQLSNTAHTNDILWSKGESDACPRWPIIIIIIIILYILLIVINHFLL